jgi:multidrug efflux pump subunit AcrA (membrane-fusion protein)
MNTLGWVRVWCDPNSWGRLMQTVGLAVGLLWAVGCQSKRADTEVVAPLSPPVRVSVAQRQDVPRVVETVGSAKASVTVQVRAQVDGQIKKIHFKEGTWYYRVNYRKEDDTQFFFHIIYRVNN